MARRQLRTLRRVSPQGRRAIRPRLDALCELETRILLTNYLVTSAADSGPGTLRAAIASVNGDVGPDLIAFNIPSTIGGVPAITLASTLQAITTPVFIDGYSQPGSSPNTLATGDNAVILIQIDGSRLSIFSQDILAISAGGSTIQGLAISSGSITATAIHLSGSGGNLVSGNFLGTDPTGTSAVGDGIGVFVTDSPANTIGGTAPADRNIISGANANNGAVFLVGPQAVGNVVQGNYIGTDASGTVGLGNTTDGVIISDSANNTIGGTVAGSANVIAASTNAGIEVFADGTVILGNLIGTDATGTGALPNANAGIILNGARSATIAGSNVISGNAGPGIQTINTFGTLIQNNVIGADVNGSALGNAGEGVQLGSPNNTIGGTVGGAGNTIAFNSLAGVGLLNSSLDYGQRDFGKFDRFQRSSGHRPREHGHTAQQHARRSTLGAEQSPKLSCVDVGSIRRRVRHDQRFAE